MRRAAKTDRNQAQIIAALRKAGATVQPLHAVGQGCPDILCGFKGRNWLLEIKDGSKPPSKRKLTPDQVEWHAGWKGQVATVCSVDEAIQLLLGAPPR